MARIVASTPFGYLVRWLSGNRLFRFPEEMPGFQLSPVYLSAIASQVSLPDPEANQESLSDDGHGRVIDLESKPEASCPEITRDGTVIVGWYDSNDQDNPHCWPWWERFMVYIQINFYTFIICVVFNLLRGPTRVHGYIWSASVSGLTWSGACSPWIWTRGFTLQPVV